MKLRILHEKVTADFLTPTKAGIGIDLARIPMTLTYEHALAAVRNEVNRKFPPQMSSTTQTRRNINKIGRGRGCGGRFARGQPGGQGRGGRGGRGNNRNQPSKTRNDSTFITLQDGQEIKYHASFHFAPTIYNKMKDTDKDRMHRERKEYSRTKGHPGQSRQIQELQQQLSVARSVQLQQPPANHISAGHVSQISQVTEGTRYPQSTMFGGRNEQASHRQRPPP
jgi:hypothetical protein